MKVTLADGFLPSPGDSFQIITFAFRSGDFESFGGLTIGPSTRLASVFRENDLSLMAAILDAWESAATGDWNQASNWGLGTPGLSTIAEISNGGTAELAGAAADDVVGIDLSSGTLTVTAGGSINILADLDVGTSSTLTVDGPTSQLTAGRVAVDGTLNVTDGAMITVDRGVSVGSAATATIDAGSDLLISGRLANFDTATATLSHGRYVVNGSLRFPNAHIVTNNAILFLGGASSEITDTSGVDALTDFAVNTVDGDFTTENRNLAVSGDFSNAGSMTIRNGSFSAVGDYAQTDGSTLLDSGTLIASTIAIQGGTLTGIGTLTATTVTNAGLVAPGFSPGIITINGDYTQESSGVLAMEIGGLEPGTQHDQLVVTGTATLAGRLDVALINDFGFTPAVGDAADIITAANVTGKFGAILVQNLPANLAVTLDYQPSTVQLRFVQPLPLRYDATSNGGVWDDGTIWEGSDKPPDSTNDVTVANDQAVNQQVSLNTDAIVRSAQVSGTTNAMSIVIQNGSRLSATHEMTVGTHGLVTVADGTLNVSGDVTIDGEGTATVTQTGGAVNLGGNLNVGFRRWNRRLITLTVAH